MKFRERKTKKKLGGRKKKKTKMEAGGAGRLYARFTEERDLYILPQYNK